MWIEPRLFAICGGIEPPRTDQADNYFSNSLIYWIFIPSGFLR